MKKTKKLMISLLTVGVLATSVAGSTFAAEKAEGQWKHNKTGWWYSYSDGTYAKSRWLKLDGKWYYFNSKGYMVTGWKKSGDMWYYLNKSGAMATGWRKIKNKWYYFDKTTGAMMTGWLEHGGYDYYLLPDGAMATGKVEVGDAWLDFDEDGHLIQDEAPYDYLVLVNKTHKLPDDWESKVVLKEATNRYGETYKVEEKALEQFLKLQKECADEGIYIELDSTTRSVAEQQELWDKWTIEKGEEYVKKYVAVPGHSEHHTGLAIDICLVVDGKRVDDNDDMIAQREIFAKIHEKLPKYGFILRFLEGKENETGYSYEPWHFRYINDPVLAQLITDEGITFEEYMGALD